ncbi:PREDICTED: putative methyl-CpG-binding domain protein 3-like 5 [Dipodomys ordii]|uniref:Methyl-CpG-binding domain protein 3-like 5 n=1 Tax=Dipodomys ordii TaxID=10020 RepID=A0A1S3GJI2_DIPOR|nr:PREDICTED: putative methyl-CpG-binding domain protein 3-like 5 [Dipodomys ordii]
MKRSILPKTLQRKKAVRVPRGQQRAKVSSILPVRMTSCVFKRSVTKITSHPDSKVRYRQEEEEVLGKLVKPQQLSGFRRLQGLQVYDSEGQRLPPFNFVNPSLIMSWGSQDDKSWGQAGAANRPVHPEPSSSQPSYHRAVIPDGGPQRLPLFKQQVTAADVRRQMQKPPLGVGRRRAPARKALLMSSGSQGSYAASSGPIRVTSR